MAEVRKYMRTVEELANLSGISENLIRTRLRQGMYKGERIGKIWMIPENQFNEVLGVSKGDNEYAREMKLRELENENKNLHMKLSTLETLLSTASNIIGS